MSRRRRPGRRKRSALLVIVTLLGFSLFQYQSNGKVSWPLEVYDQLKSTIGDYATSPDSGWRKAAEGVEWLGEAREGRLPGDFDIQGRVVGVSDGDSFVLLDDSGDRINIRLFGIDTPEWDQPHGAQAKKALVRLVSNRQIGLVVVDKDGYGRTVATAYLGQKNINLSQLENGHAWWYRRYAPYERHLQDAEKQARQLKLGLWSAANPIPPWEWRRR